jgi:hypothetical protein
VGVVVAEPVRASSASAALDVGVNSYLTELQKWIGT